MQKTTTLHFWIVFILIFSPCFLSAQNLDSLRKEYHQAEPQSEAQVEALSGLVRAFDLGNQLDSMRWYARIGGQLLDQPESPACDNRVDLTYFLNKQANFHFRTTQYDSAEYYWEKVQTLACECPELYKKCIDVRVNLAQICRDRGQVSRMNQLLADAHDLAKNKGDTALLAAVKLQQANALIVAQDYVNGLTAIDSALILLRNIDTTQLTPIKFRTWQANYGSAIGNRFICLIGGQYPPSIVLPQAEVVKDYYTKLNGGTSMQVGQTYIQLGAYFYGREDMERAEEAWLRAEEILAEIPGGIGPLLKVWFNLGNVYSDRGEHLVSYRYWDSIGVHASRLGMAQDVWMGKMGRAAADIQLGRNPIQARDTLLLIKNTAQANGDYTILPNAILTLGMAERVLENYDASVAYFEEAREMGEQFGVIELILKAKKEIALTYEEAGDFERALALFTDADQMQDSINSERNRSAVAQMETFYRTQAKDDTLQLLAQEAMIQQEREAQETASRQRWQAIAGGTGVGLLSLGLLAFTFYRSRRRTQQDAERISFLHRELDHRVKNNLNFLSSMLALQSAKEQKPDVQVALGATKSRVQALVILHQLMRDENGEKGKIALPQYLNPLIHQVKEMAHPREAPLDLTIQIEPISIPEGDALSLALILNEWLTNAFKYAVPKVESPQISIRVSAIGNDQLVLEVADNGPGYEPAAVASSSYGTTLVQSQIRQLRGQLQFDNSQGTHYTLTFKTSIEK